MPSVREDDGDEQPGRRSSTRRPLRKTVTGETQKTANTSRLSDPDAKQTRRPMRELSTDQPLTAPKRRPNQEERIQERRRQSPQSGASAQIAGDEALKRQIKQEVEDVLREDPTLLHTSMSASDHSNLQRREQVMANTIFDEDDSFDEDRRLKACLRREQQDQANLMAAKCAAREGASRPYSTMSFSDSSDVHHREKVMAHTVFGDDSSYAEDQKLKASLRREQREQAHLLAAKDASTAVGDEPDVFVDEPSEASSTPGPLPRPSRQSNTALVSRPGAFQGNPGSSFVRNTSDWREPFIATQLSGDSSETLPLYTPPPPSSPSTVGSNRRPPPSLHMDCSDSLDSTDELLVEAQPVDEESLDPAELELAKPAKHFEEDRRRRKMQLYIGILLILFIALFIGLVVGLVVRSQRKDTPPKIVYQTQAPSSAPTNSPTLAPTSPYVEGLPEETLRIIESNETSPQAKAYQWLGADPFRSNYSEFQKLQRFVLATFYYSTNGVAWTNATDWLEYGIDECKWFDTMEDNTTLPCNEEGEYQRLVLANNTLNGTLPPEIGLLTALKELDVSDNVMQGSFPTQLGQLTNLSSLALHTNYMEGDLPTEVGLLTLMEEFHVFDNEFQGSLPTEIGLMTLMRDWHMKETDIGGPIPTQIGNWGNLQSMWTWNTQLNGTLPSEMGRLTNLTYLAMHNGDLQGTIPTQFGLLTSMVYLQLDVHNLNGTIPSELAQLQDIVLLSFGGNQLQSTLPSELGLLKKLQALRFHQNQLTGIIPTEFGKLELMQRLELDGNQIVGTIPSELAQVPFLRKLYLGNNRLRGSLPPELGRLDYLQDVTLISNQRLGGTIPAEWGDLASLQELFLTGVAITGVIPAGLCNISRLAIDCNADVCGCKCGACG